MKTSSRVKIDAVCLNPHISYLQREIEDMDIADEDIIVVEMPKSKDIWILQPMSAQAQMEEMKD